MRLLFVVQGYGPDVAGGAETACRALATRLAARGHQVEVLSAAPGPEPTETVEEGVTVHRLGRARPVDAARSRPAAMASCPYNFKFFMMGTGCSRLRFDWRVN